MRLTNLIFMLCCFLIVGCIEPYDFDVSDVDNTIIVDAELSDSLSFQQIKLSYQNRLDDQRFNGVPNAKVFVEDDLNNSIQFIEIEPGIYEAFFGGDRERKYKLNIDIENGGSITSDFQGIPPPIQIDSVDFEELQESFVNEDGKNRTINVVKAFGNVSINNNEEDLFLRFGNIETVFLFRERKTVTFPPPKSCFVYNKDVVPEIEVFEVKAGSQNVNVKAELFTKPIDWEFGTVFSVRAELISMNEDYYEYWKEIEEVYTQDGNINNPPPARVRTNLQVENRPQVVGFFSMTSKSSDVVFIRRSDLTTQIILFCGSEGGPFPWPYPAECNECLLVEGATTNRPDYW